MQYIYIYIYIYIYNITCIRISERIKPLTCKRTPTNIQEYAPGRGDGRKPTL